MKYRPPKPKASPDSRSEPYDTVSVALTIGLALLPIPMILVLLAGNYSPRTKLLWSITAAIEATAACAMMLATVYYLRDALTLL